MNVVHGFNIKHIIDLTPVPGDYQLKLSGQSCSYFALCATTDMKDFQEAHLKAQIIKAMTTSDSPLFGKRLLQ